MPIETALISGGAIVLTLIITLAGAVWWFGKLSGRVQRLENDVRELQKDQKMILELLNRHLGFHEGRDTT